MEWHHRIERRLDLILELFGPAMSTLADILATEAAIKDDIARVAGIVADLEKQVADLKAQIGTAPAQADIDAAAQAAVDNKSALDAIQAPAT